MMKYALPYHEPFSFAHAALGEIAQNPWGAKNPPRTVFQASFVQKFGMLIQISSYEKDPVATFHKNGDPVWTDSCVEAFLNFAPEKSDQYLNIEISAGGGVLIGVGNGREGRRPITDFAPYPKATVTVRDEMWDALILVPLELIEAVYGKIDFKPGYAFKGNFQKCCEEKNVHFLTWNPVEAPEPDFHRPECFGDLVLE